MKARFTDNQTAAMIGRIVIIEELVERLTGELRETREEVGQKDHRIRFLEERVAQLTRPRTLLTEKEAAELLRVHVQTLKRWRDEHPAPRIRFIQMLGGDVRYRPEDIESYLNACERGGKRALKAA